MINITKGQRVDTLLIGADSDYIFPMSIVEETSKILGCNLKVLENCGHSGFIEQHSFIKSLIRKFILGED